MRRAAQLLTLLSALVIFAAPAAAHEMPDESKSPFYAEVRSIEPDVPGWELLAIGSEAIFEIHVEPGHVVEVLGYQDEPYLRVDAEGNAFANTNSPSFRANETAAGPLSDDPDAPALDAEPEWVWQKAGGGIEWHDHRIHWMSPDKPKVGADNVAQSWSVSLVVDGTPVTAAGELLLNPEIPFEDYAALMPAADGHDTADGHDDSDGHSHDTVGTVPASGDDSGSGGLPVLPIAAGVVLLAGVGVGVALSRKPKASADKG